MLLFESSIVISSVKVFVPVSKSLAKEFTPTSDNVMSPELLIVKKLLSSPEVIENIVTPTLSIAIIEASVSETVEFSEYEND